MLSPNQSSKNPLRSSQVQPPTPADAAAPFNDRVKGFMGALELLGDSTEHPSAIEEKFKVRDVCFETDQIRFSAELNGWRAEVLLCEEIIRNTSSPMSGLGYGKLQILNDAWVGTRKFDFDRSDQMILKKVVAVLHKGERLGARWTRA